MVKKALVLGLNYLSDSSSSLGGCITDAKNLKQLLVDHLGYSENDVLMCTDETSVKPTKSVILRLLREMCLWTHRQNVEQLFISYSGHGTQVADESHDEVDGGQDSCLVPLDFRTNGLITDDELGTLIRQVHPRTDVIFLIDACHSGTMCDLPYLYRAGDKYAVESDASVPCRALMISGCQDSETSQETFVNKHIAGAMTTAFIGALSKYNYDITCFKLIRYMQEALVSAGLTQRPQLSTSRQLTETCVFISSNENGGPFFQV